MFTFFNKTNLIFKAFTRPASLLRDRIILHPLVGANPMQTQLSKRKKKFKNLHSYTSYLISRKPEHFEVYFSGSRNDTLKKAVFLRTETAATEAAAAAAATAAAATAATAATTTAASAAVGGAAA